ncbi:MAG: Gfo/Idh/MocA family oxidoreductase [Rhizobiales bacterium]|nr:Gfo/Idh/MocA family oxidoreductase [Hyphomicrobiales bacterium]
MAHKQFGIAVIGSGRMGSIRAGLASQHPAVNFLAVSDKIEDKARKLANDVKANRVSTNNDEIIDMDEVGAVIVSTSEPEHCAPAVRALEQGKSVLVEKPMALSVEDCDQMLNAAERGGASIHIGYSLRFNRHYLVGRDQARAGKLGRIVTCVGRLYNTRGTALAILKRSEEATFIQDALTYMVDLFGWYLSDATPVEIVARQHGLVYRDMGYDADEAASAIITYSNGAIVNIALGYALPINYPTHGRLIRAEILGEKGVLLFDDDHKQAIGYSEDGMSHAYVGHSMEMSFLTSNASGNWALGKYWGPLGDETRAWLDYLSTGVPCPNATGTDGRRTVQVTRGIEHAAATGETVNLPGSNA